MLATKAPPNLPHLPGLSSTRRDLQPSPLDAPVRRQAKRVSNPRGRPPRPMPDDFAERFAEHGWAGTAAHYYTGDPQVKRWREEYGVDRLTAKRAALVRERRELRARERRKAYR